ncbi:SdrD B-like domain-containing protein [Ilumatobacter coccineus]|uniref:SdrD B-like domain-containing protein n=1 Tax=Ilumatobacter coccineus TaxID=467094 RepID=UPI00138AD378|nr:SdrD B-like domain-containing protein [Ilumatobacter coccineus]
MPTTSSIGDRVWLDRNADGVQDPGEPGLNRVDLVVVHLGPNGAPGGGDDVSYDATTSGDGDWTVAGLPAGKYVVTVTGGLPAGVEATYDADSAIGSADQTSMVVIDGDEVNQDFGYTHRAAIGDTVFSDNNLNGVQDAREYGAYGIEIRVTDLGADGARGGGDDSIVGTYTTNSLGEYLAPGLLDGTYAVDIVGGLPDGVEFTVDPQGTTDPDGLSITTITGGRDDLTQDFGYTPTVVGNNTIGDTVFHDANRNGIDDGPDTDPRLAGVGVRITFLGEDREVGGGDDVVIGTFLTDDTGRYQATGLPDGRYLVEVVSGLPAGFEPTVDPQGTVDPDGRSTVTLANESTNRDQDFGFAGTIAGSSSIGDSVYLDADLDGVQDDPSDEPGIPSVRVTLVAAGPDGDFGTPDDVIDERFTDEQGNYLFDGLSAGEYRVIVDESTVPAALRNTDDEDGDNDGASPVTLGDDDAHLTADFGYGEDPVVLLGSIGDRIYLDTNGDGVQGDPTDEPGLAGVVVRLTSGGSDGQLGTADDVAAEQETGLDGSYLFDELPANEYRIDVIGGVVNRLVNTDDPDGGGDSSSVVTLGEGDDRTDQDFGYDPGDPADAFLGDRVWFDTNRNGVQESGEPGLNGVTVTLTLPDGTTRATTTSGNGDYLFTDLEPGEYTVTVGDGLPRGVVPTYDADDRIAGPDGASTTDLATSDLDQDFGYVGTGSIGDTVFYDLDVDGVQDDGEPGVPGVPVTVIGAGFDGEFGTSDDITVTATTDDTGNYTVGGLPAGDYVVAIDDGSLPDGTEIVTDPDGDADGTASVTLAPGESDDEQDFGVAIVGSIGDTIFLDTNGDGDQGDPADEPGLGGVTVTLTDDNGTVRTTTTDDDGTYLFDGLPAGDYTVTVTGGLPANVDNTADPDGNAAGGELGDSTSDVTLLPGDDDLDQDFGYDTGDPTDAVLGDRVWFDVDRDGEQDAGEPGINGVTVTATDGDGATFTAITAGDGDYLFTELTDGTYTVTVTDGIPAGFGPTADSDTPADGTNSAGDETSTTDLVSVDLAQDFGYAGNSSLGDLIWIDRDGDGVLDDDEVGLPGVRVTVTWAGPDGQVGTDDDVTLTATTDENGEYLVEGLPAGSYQVSVDETSLPDGAQQTYGLAGGNEAPQSSVVVALAADTDRDDVDFAYRGDSSIGDTVFLDLDEDGTRGDDEPGIPGVTVVLAVGGVTFTDVTDENGEYLFDGLFPGDHVVEVDETTLPDDLRITVDEDGGVAADGGDPDGTTPVELGVDDQHLTADFGYANEPGGRIGDTVFLDLDGNGVQDDGEPGLPGQAVTLVGDNGVTEGVVTDGNGEYLFEGLPDGSYTVIVDGGIVDLANNSADPDGGTPNTSDVVIDADDREHLDQDFGYVGPNSVGDTIFFDADADGIDGDGADEPGLPGVDVVVTWAGPDGEFGTGDDVALPAATTDDDGEYVVAGLPDGTFTVAVDESTLPDAVNPTVDVGDAAGGNPDAPVDGVSTVVLGDEGDGPEDDRDQDFGYVSGGSISGTVVLDLDGDETRDAGEPGLGGIRVVLTLPDGTERETFTDELGGYSFPGLQAGDYVVTVDESTVPGGTVASIDPDDRADGTTEVTLESNDDVVDVDFGYVGSGEIGGVTFLDLAGDGVQDPADPVVPGQSVTVTWAGPDGEFGTADDLDVSTSTDDDGAYLVDGLPDGDYIVSVGPDGLPSSAINTADPDGGEPNVSEVTLGDDGRSELDEDFGYQGDNSIGDTVYVDANGNGEQDDASIDTPVEGALVTITWAGPDGELGTSDDVVIESTTDADGIYGASGLPDGSYTVVVDPETLPSGTAPLVDPDGGAPDGQSAVELTGGTNADDQDFGIGGGATIGDEVWLDLDGDGERDLGEPGLTGATVTATYLGADGVPGGGDDVVFTTTVDDAGNYLFDDIPAGTYDIRITELPAGMFPTADPDGGDDNTSRVSVGLDEEDLEQDFGYVGSAGVGDEIFLDLDSDGVRDPNEPGIAGVGVTVTSAGVDGVLGTDDDLVVTTTTDEDGRYIVEGLPPGPTQVTYDAGDLPEGVEPLGDLDGDAPTSTTITLNSGETIRDVDFPVGGDGIICGTIFDDTDGDGVQDAGEPGLPGVTVEVTWQGPDGAVVVAVVTDANGDWCLENLPPGDYSVEVDPATLPPGSTDGGGPNTVVLGVGGEADIDVGTTPSGGIFGGVFNDTNGNGQRDPGETGTPDVTVILVAASGDEADRTSTDSDGNYEFENLPPGTYTVIVDPATVPPGTAIITETDGVVDGRTTVQVTPGRTAIGGGFGVGSDRVAVLPTTGSSGTNMLLRVAFASIVAGLMLALFRRRGDDVLGRVR